MSANSIRYTLIFLLLCTNKVTASLDEDNDVCDFKCILISAIVGVLSAIIVDMLLNVIVNVITRILAILSPYPIALDLFVTFLIFLFIVVIILIIQIPDDIFVWLKKYCKKVVAFIIGYGGVYYFNIIYRFI
jgi:hypothetical protein